mmetsp:Transcript_39323/g.97155  ORF Transcript_39323/g.97155 Transcript_39323/m.97155 type:complete len:263 (-) Transcript_39323:299-1087(-)
MDVEAMVRNAIPLTKRSKPSVRPPSSLAGSSLSSTIVICGKTASAPPACPVTFRSMLTASFRITMASRTPVKEATETSIPIRGEEGIPALGRGWGRVASESATASASRFRFVSLKRRSYPMKLTATSSSHTTAMKYLGAARLNSKRTLATRASASRGRRSASRADRRRRGAAVALAPPPEEMGGAGGASGENTMMPLRLTESVSIGESRRRSLLSGAWCQPSEMASESTESSTGETTPTASGSSDTRSTQASSASSSASSSA